MELIKASLGLSEVAPVPYLLPNENELSAAWGGYLSEFLPQATPTGPL